MIMSYVYINSSSYRDKFTSQFTIPNSSPKTQFAICPDWAGKTTEFRIEGGETGAKQGKKN